MATTPHHRLRIVAYLRVSTDAQAEDGFGLEVQEAAVARWLKASGHRLTKTCTDEGVSGTIDALDREGLSCAISAIELDEADALLVPRLDRLARRLTVQEAVLAQVWQRGGRVFTVEAGEVLPDDPDDPMRTAMRQMVGVFSELDRGQISKRLRDGRLAKAAAGKYAAGAPPFGWKPVDGDLVVNPVEQGAIARMRELRAEGMSLRSIAAVLEADGVPSKRGGKWAPSAISRVLDDEARTRARIGQQKRRTRAASQ